MLVLRAVAGMIGSAALVAACSGASSGGVGAPGPDGAVDAPPLPSTTSTVSTATPPHVDAGPVPEHDASTPPAEAGSDSSKPEASTCPAADVPLCTKGPANDAACSLYAPPSTPYGCANDIGNGCAMLSSGNAWCCPTPAAPSRCSAGDPFCASRGAAACGLTRGCLDPGPGCRHFPDGAQTIWCCPP